MVPRRRGADDVRVGVVQVEAVKMDPVGLAEVRHADSADGVAAEPYLLQFGSVGASEVLAGYVVEQIVLDVDIGKVGPVGLRKMAHSLLAYPVPR